MATGQHSKASLNPSPSGVKVRGAWPLPHPPHRGQTHHSTGDKRGGRVGGLSPQPPLLRCGELQGDPQVLGSARPDEGGGEGEGEGGDQAGRLAPPHPARRHSAPQSSAPCHMPGSCSVGSSPPAYPHGAPPRGLGTPGLQSPTWTVPACRSHSVPGTL